MSLFGSQTHRSDANTVKKRVLTPVVLQMHGTECGAACLSSILGFFGRWVSLSELRIKCEVSRDGSSAASILRAAKHYGLDCKGVSGSIDLLKKLDMPVILFWQFSHFVVLEGFDENYYYLNDPATGRMSVTAEEFEKSYSGIALRFAVTEAFTPGGEPPDLFAQLRTLLGGSWASLLGVSACGLMLALLSLLIPASLAVFVDDLLRNIEPWRGLILVLLGGAIATYLLTVLKHLFLKRLAIRISVTGFDWGMTRLLRLPLEFFQYRMVTDITDRVASIDQIAKNLTERFFVLALDLVMSAILLVAMLVFSPLLTLIVLLLALLHGFIGRMFNPLRVTRSQAMRHEQSALMGIGMQMLTHVENLRMTGSEDRFFVRWTAQQAIELKARQLYAELLSWSAALPGLISMLRSAALLSIGGWLVVEGELSLGTLVGFYLLAELFLTPVGRYLEFADERKVLETDLQRLEDISQATEDPIFVDKSDTSSAIQTFNGKFQLAGHIELRDVTFGFHPSRPPLLQNFSLTIRPGQRVAIVGPSGSGKSTVAKLVSGVYQPWSGEIRFDGQPVEEIPVEVLRRSLSMVDQDVVLFPVSVRENITLWNPFVPDQAIYGAARDACIHNEILVRPKGYETEVENGGVNFSGGQRQRLEIARALVGNPTALILDEATSALDATTEEEVDNALRRRGITCLIIAHRLSTVRDCDEIIVLDKGVEVQRGLHDELLEDRNGTYYNLIKSS